MRDDLSSSQSPHARPLRRTSDGCAQATQQLRILATTDIHMQLLGHDYVQDRTLPHHGLAGLATLIDRARDEARDDNMACLLFDNGDLLQGSALGDSLSREEVTAAHPVVRCLRALSYDALGVGNHDLDHGLSYPLDIAALCNTPMISANLSLCRPSPLINATTIECLCPEAHGHAPTLLRIGVISVLPDQTALWHRHILLDHATVAPARDALIKAVQDLRDQEVDLVILLAHMGIDAIVEDRHPGGPPHEDARTLAALPGIDAIIAGHTHRRLPGQDHAGYRDVDVVKGTLVNRPAVMPGFDASDLAVIDLDLQQDKDGRWQVVSHATQLRPNTADVPPHPKITAICTPTHEATRNALAEPVGHTARPLHNFFSLAMPTETCALVAQAKRQTVAKALRGSAEARLPLLATASAHTAGGRSGPGHFLYMPQGPVLRRHLAGLDPYANAICGLRVTGAEIKRWLEHAAGVFCHLSRDCPDQPLIKNSRPTFDFDTIYGLTYTIDPMQPAGTRIAQIAYDGQPVSADQPFMLATSLFRAAGGGGGPQFAKDQIVFKAQTSIADAISTVLSQQNQGSWENTQPWRFDCMSPVQAVLRTTPEAALYLSDITHLAPQPLGLDGQGFAQMRLTL